LRGDTSIGSAVHDLCYIQNWSLRLDLRICGGRCASL
jgi:hypothetical protein